MAYMSATGEESRLVAAVRFSPFVGAGAGVLLLAQAHVYAPLLSFLIIVTMIEPALRRLRRRGRGRALHHVRLNGG